MAGEAAEAEGAMRYRLDVIGGSVPDVVENAGGWLFDRRMAGWDVTVLVPAEQNLHPLRILGVDSLPLGLTRISFEQRPHPQGLAVAADLLTSDVRVRQAVIEVLEQGLPEIIVWGGPWPGSLVSSNREMHHELSAAARAFKHHAIIAASGHDSGGRPTMEKFQCATIESPSSLERALFLRHGQTA